MKKKIAILDFDGTLADTRPVIIETFHRTFDAMHLAQHTDSEIAATIGLPLIQAFPHLEPMGAELAAECTDCYRRIFDNVTCEIGVPMFPHVADTLRALHDAGLTLTIATSRGHASTEEFLRNFGLDGIIRYIVAAEDVKYAKPHHEPVETTLRELGFSACETIVVGDTHFDIQMGRNAGCETVGVTYGNGSRESLQEAGATCIIDDFKEMLRIIA